MAKMRVRYTFLCLLMAYATSFSAQNMKFFSSEQRQAAGKLQTIVMDFLERYTAQHQGLDAITLKTRLADDKVFFRRGSIADLSQVNDTMPFSINLNDRYYEVGWMKDQRPFVTIAFPAQYDLLLGMKQDEAQQRFKEFLTDSLQRKGKPEMPHSYALTKDSVLKYQSERFELEDMTNAVYYHLDDSLPVYDKAHLEYAAANLLLGHIADTHHRLYIEQSVYGMKSINYFITLEEWLNYCAAWNLKLFFGIEEHRQDGIIAIVIAQSRELGFNHLMSVVIPDKFTADRNCILKARLTPYIPIHNVKELFSKESKNRKKIQWK